MKTCRPDVFFTTVSYPIKGTPYYDRDSEDRLVSPADGRRAPIATFEFRDGTPADFYRHADELLRSEMASEPGPDKHSGAREGLHANRSRSEV